MIDKNNDIYTYETGIIIQPEFGWYLELAVRSSLHKKGYILANSVGIIDRTYINSIKVVLYKFDKNKPDLELPIRAVQLIPKMIIHPKLIEIKDNEMNIKYDISSKSKNGLILGNSNNDTIWNTSRGTKGFGSSGT